MVNLTVYSVRSIWHLHSIGRMVSEDNIRLALKGRNLSKLFSILFQMKIRNICTIAWVIKAVLLQAFIVLTRTHR